MAFVRRWWRYGLVLLGLVAGVLVAWSRRRPAREILGDSAERFQEVRHIVAIEVQAARQRETDVKERLHGTLKIKDVTRRRTELLSLYREVSR